MHVWVSDANKEIWRELRYLTSPANVKSLLMGNSYSGRKEKWNESDALRASYEISACVRQADEYFHAASEVGLPTKPLLLFYGAQSLAKATILANDPTMELLSLNYHGLHTRPKTPELKTYAEDPVSWTLEDEFAISHNGVFRHLCRICGDSEPNDGVIYRFKELVRIIPDLADLFLRHYRELSHCVYLFDGPKIETDSHLHVYFIAHYDGIEKVFPEFQSGFERVKHKYPGYKKVDSVDLDFAYVENGTIAKRFLIRPLNSGIHKSTSVLFAALFILSNVVRYKPSFWMDVIEGRNSGSVAVAESLCNVFERRFPNDILDSIFQESFTFGAPSYIG